MRASGAPLLLALSLGLVASPAFAAPARTAKAPSPSAPDLFFGYSYTHAGEANLNGIGLSGSFPLGDRLSLVLDLSGHTGSFAGADLDQLGIMAGARWRFVTGRVRPFAEALAGVARTKTTVDTGAGRVGGSDSDWALALGGGLDYELSAHWSVRGLFHLRFVHGEGVWDTDPRFAVGASYRFGQ
jgi:opacity protein-like surface antigen